MMTEDDNQIQMNVEGRFTRTGSLTRRKLLEYIPTMLMTNLSTLLLISVDGLVVGNLVGSNALSAVNILYPATLAIGVISVLIANGAATSLSTRMGENDRENILYAKSAVNQLMIAAAVFVAIAQIPVVFWIIQSCQLSPELNQLTWQYAIGIMISMPFGLISTVGVCQLQIVGKMKPLMWLAVLEGGVNLLLDLFFVGVLKMGVAGAGFGTAGANIVRCSATALYLSKKTDIYNCGNMKARPEDRREILSLGLPEASHSLMLALQNYIMIRLILARFGDGGGVIKGVCAFSFSLMNVLISGVQGSMRPLAGLMSGAEDRTGLRMLMRQSGMLVTVFACAMTLLIELFPGLFYALHGVSMVPEGGLFSLRLYALYFVFRAYDTLFRLYLTNRGDAKFSTGLTLMGYATLPFFAFVLTRFLPGPYLWLSYLFTEILIFSLNLWRYRTWLKKDQTSADPSARRLSLTVKPDEAVEASRQIRRWAMENGFMARIANRVSLCMEEMVAYAETAQKRRDMHIEIFILFTKGGARFTMLDDGRCIALDEAQETQKLITDNYGLLKKLAKSVRYQYILNMNYIGNDMLLPETREQGAGWTEAVMEYERNAAQTPQLGFAFDSAAVETEMGALANVDAEYLISLCAGTVDPDEKLPEYREKLKKAGIEKVVAEANLQLEAYLAF